MKYKARLTLTCLVAVTFVISLILFVELTADQWSEDINPPYFDTKLGAVQGHNHDALRIHNTKKKPDLRLKNLDDDIKTHLNSRNKDGDSQEMQSLLNKTAMYDGAIHDGAVDRLLQTLDNLSKFGFTRHFLRNTKFEDIALQLGRRARDNSKLLLEWDSEELADVRTSNYVRFHHHIRAGALYDPKNPAINGLLRDMATDRITSVEMMERGTELKLLMQFMKGTIAVFKPMRFGRDHETLPNHFYFDDFERHNAEIAAFHLDRVLGFYRVPPVTGRLVNITNDIFRLAENKLKKTIYVSPVGNLCFYGACSYYCDSRHSFCGNVDMIEGSLMVWLPEGDEAKRDETTSPYRRSYSQFKKAKWETDDEYCNELRAQQQPYLYERFISDLVDIHIFDFLTGNMDRHDVEVFRQLRNATCPIHLDNGRGFGKPNVDDFSIIAPLRQCCQIRKSTFLKLAKLYIGPERLSEQLDTSMKSDPLYPIILPAHLNAIDRRVLHILRIVAKCVEKRKSINNVIVNDNY